MAGGAEAGAGVLFTPGAGAGLLTELSPIATAMPTSSSATAVPIITTAGNRYQGRIFGSGSGSGRGSSSCSKFSDGRAAV